MPKADHFQIANGAAQFYDRLPARYLLGPWSAGLVHAAELAPGDRVIDLACGTGIVAREAAKRLGSKGHVTGLDLNEAMLDVAKSYNHSGACATDWVRASAQETGLSDSAYDVALSQQGLQFFPDKDKALTETHRILKAGGRAYFSVWAAAGPYNEAVAEAVRLHIDDATAERSLQSRAVPSADDLRRMFEAAGFQDVSVRLVEMTTRLPNIVEFVAEHLLGVPIADRVCELSDAEREALGRDAADRLAAFADGNDVLVPDSIHLVSARR